MTLLRGGHLPSIMAPMSGNRRASGRQAKSAGANLIARGREALESGAWETARDLLQKAVGRDPNPAALEWLGWAYYWLDDGERLFETRHEAYRGYLACGDRRGAARVAMWLAYDHLEFRGERAIADGLLQRARELLDGLEPSPEHAWLDALTAHEVLLGQKDPARAVAIASEGKRIAVSTGAREVEVLLDAQVGVSMVTQGEVEEGMRRLDRAAAAALGGEITDLPAIATVPRVNGMACSGHPMALDPVANPWEAAGGTCRPQSRAERRLT